MDMKRKQTTTVATRVTVEDRLALEWLAAHKGMSLSAVLDKYGTERAVELAREIQDALDPGHG